MSEKCGKCSTLCSKQFANINLIRPHDNNPKGDIIIPILKLKVNGTKRLRDLSCAVSDPRSESGFKFYSL